MKAESMNVEAIAVEVEEEVEDLDEVNEVLPTSYSITSYGADYPVDGLVKRLEQGDITVPQFSSKLEEGQPAGFQREFVWKRPQCDRFIESLLLGLPVPGIFLVKETSGRFLVLDGQQRLKTLQAFYSGVLQKKEFELDNVQQKWKNKSYKTLDAADRRRLDDSIIHATIVRQDEPSDDQSSIYLIFERLNSGGTFLQPQEIRVALYHGALATLLIELNENEDWRMLYGKKSARQKDLELILRFLAMFYDSGKYGRPMKEFLNSYMASNRALKIHSAVELTKLFAATVRNIREHIGVRAFRLRKAVNAAMVDAVMVGVAHRLTSGNVTTPAQFKTQYDQLLTSADFQTWVTRSTADEDFVNKRLDRARGVFQSVK
jgi:hypothetical protein